MRMPARVGGGLHHLAGARQAEKSGKGHHDDDRAGEHGELLRDHHDAADHDRFRRGDGRKWQVVALPSPDDAGRAAQHEGNADRGEDEADDVGILERPEGDQVGRRAQQEAEGHRRQQRRQVGHAHLHVQHPGDEAREHEQLAVSEVDHGGRLVHHHDSERDQGVERTRRQSAQQ
jgi:hypothetical protein